MNFPDNVKRAMVTLGGNCDALTAAIKKLKIAITRAVIIFTAPNRIKHLILHGKNERVRKKNFNRAKKIYERSARNATQLRSGRHRL